MKYSIQRAATYGFPAEVRASVHYLRLIPQSSARQQVLEWKLTLPNATHEMVDPHGNLMQVLTVEGLHSTIELGISGVVEIDENCECEPGSETSPLPYLRQTELTSCSDEREAFAREVCGEVCDRAALVKLMQALHEELVVKAPAAEEDAEGAQLQIQAPCQSRSVANQHSHAFIACARALGVPARYVAGYLFDPEGGDLTVHGWAEAWFEGAWYSFDVTNNLSRASRHLKLAVGLDAMDACPVRGTSRSSGMMVGLIACRQNQLKKLG